MTVISETWIDQPVLINPCKSREKAWMLLAHGAGAPMDSTFMEQLASQLANDVFTVVRFEFPYMQVLRNEQKKPPPNRLPKLIEHWQRLLALAAKRTDQPLVVSGKSMGGRVASMVLADKDALMGEALSRQVRAGVCFGYPFHPPSKPDKLRVEHLQQSQQPLCIVQGTRDALGKPAEVASYNLSATTSVEWLESGDHDFKPLKRTGKTQAELIEQSAIIAKAFALRELVERGSDRS